eukprot:m.109169 g.109169  ORF g.109169 m.109169 type:complete len:69 (-) comp15884_c0_seq2:76-282(-)
MQRQHASTPPNPHTQNNTINHHHNNNSTHTHTHFHAFESFSSVVGSFFLNGSDFWPNGFVKEIAGAER